MKYEAPEVTALTSAVGAIQSSSIETNKTAPPSQDSAQSKEGHAAYADWEE